MVVRGQGKQQGSQEGTSGHMSDQFNQGSQFWQDRKEFAKTIKLFNQGICKELKEYKSPISLKHTSEDLDKLSEIIRYNYLFMPLEDNVNKTAWAEFKLIFHHRLNIRIERFLHVGAPDLDDIVIEYHDPTRFNPVFIADLMVGETK